MADIPLTQEQRDALHARQLDDEAISLLSSLEEATQIIRNVTPERAHEIISKAAFELTPRVPPSEPNKVIHLAERAQEVLEITELEPCNQTFIGKRINLDGILEQEPHVLLWWQRVVRVPATIAQLHLYLCEARKRNIILISGAPANLGRLKTRRWKSTDERSDKDGPHGFLDEPTHVFFMDGDGIEISWSVDPERAIRAVVAQLGEPWISASYVWFLSATCGLELVEYELDGKKYKRWTGKLINGKLRVRLAFLTDRALNQSERTALTNIARARIPKFDQSICRIVQPNYIQQIGRAHV